MEEMLKQILSKLDTLEKGQQEIRCDVQNIKLDIQDIKNELIIVNKKLDQNTQEHRAMFELLESDVQRVEQENFSNWKEINQLKGIFYKNKTSI